MFTKIFFTIFLFSIAVCAQGPGEPYNPMTAIGAKGIHQLNHILYWENPSVTIYNEIYFSEDSSLVNSLDPSIKILDGYPSTVYDSVYLNLLGELGGLQKYYWKVVEHNSSGYTVGPLWYFRTTSFPGQLFIFNDDFSDGADNWTITNDGGTCVWQSVPITYNNYLLPAPAGGNVLAADADNCGNGTTTLTSAIVTLEFDPMYLFFDIEWDNDWRTYNSFDSAFVEASRDSGNTWEIIAFFNGNDVRGSHELYSLYTSPLIEADVLYLRFRTVQPGWHWWWAVDNVKVTYFGVMEPNYPPSFLSASAIPSEQRVSLSWDIGSCYGGQLVGYKIERKEGLPTSPTQYVSIIDSLNSYSFIDENVQPEYTYTYRVRSLCGFAGEWTHPSNEATAYVPDITPGIRAEKETPTEFSLEQNYPNPFNPATTIKYQIPELSFVTLKIFDVLGNEIATLINEEKPAGSYEVEFDATGLSSGIYFYRLETGNFTKMNKMILLQ